MRRRGHVDAHVELRTLLSMDGEDDLEYESDECLGRSDLFYRFENANTLYFEC